MKVKMFGAFIKEYEEKASQWFAENESLQIKHIATSMNQAGDWILTAVFYEEKAQPGETSSLHE
jgi:hypothetical protein